MQKLYYNGEIITMEGEGQYAEALLVEDGLIKVVGTKAEAEGKKAADCEMVDLAGKTLMPSFIDGHSHFGSAGQYSIMCNLEEAKNFDDIASILKKFIDERTWEPGDVVVGYAYDHNFLEEGRHPDKKVLDRASSELPIMISHTSGHMGVVNSKGLELAGYDENTPDMEGGLIDRYPGTREPNGYLEELAILGLRSKLDLSKYDLSELMIAGQKEYLAHGITTAQDGGTSLETISLLKKADAEGKLKLDVVTYPSPLKAMTADLEEVMTKHADCVKKYTGHVKIGGYKILLDGSPQGRTAWMSKPYVAFEGDDPDYCAYPWLKHEEAKACVQKAIDDNQQLLCHCNGDAASEEFVSLYEECLTTTSNPNKDNLRPVMIHCQTVRDDQLDRMAKLHMVPSIFVAHTWYWGDVHLKNFGPERGSRVSPVKSALDRGLYYNLHTDTPVVKPKMLHSVWAAVNRITRGGVEIGPEQRVGVYDALKGITINAAHCYFEEDSKGSLKAGKRADLVILDQNPLKIDKMKIRDIQVLETIKDGETVYQK